MWSDSQEDATAAVRCGQLHFACADLDEVLKMRFVVSQWGWDFFFLLLRNQRSREEGDIVCGVNNEPDPEPKEDPKEEPKTEGCVIIT